MKLKPGDSVVVWQGVMEPGFMLTRYDCYLIAQNGDPKKEQIAFADQQISKIKLKGKKTRMNNTLQYID